MEADIPSGETNRELETDGNVVTKAEDDEAASFPTVESNRELGTDGEGALKAEVDEAANREMETGGEEATVAKEDEHDSIPAAEANREMGTKEEATDRESAIKAVFDEAAHREMETDGEEVTVAKENEPASIPTAEANREMETVDVATVDEDKDDALISITEASKEMETDVVEALKAEEDEAASIPMVEVRRQLETDQMHTMKAEDDENASVPTGEADLELETDGDDGMDAEDRETAKYIPKAEDGEGSSVPTEEGNRELETDGEAVMEVKDSETATYITKAEHRDDASVPTEKANRELETDRDDVMEVEDKEIASVQTVEGNREFIDEAEDITRSEDGEAASMLEDSQEDPQYGENEASTAEETATEIETETDIVHSGEGFSGKHKKRKNSNSPSTPKTTTRASRRKVTGEDVCFICFDGGDLVLCDRRGCPKAYHPSCVNRDEAFFRAKGRWNCGWHQCSICEKNPHYMCYTCPYSLCKGCIKGAVFLCIRRNKGFCETCMRVVRLIESKQQGGEDIHVDFDDKSSWEFLFKDYYMDLKEKLSLSSEEIADAKSPWKGSDVSGSRHEQSAPQFDSNEDGGSGSDISGEKVEVNSSKRRKITKKSKSLSKEAAMSNMPVIAGNEGTSTPGSTTWASKELIEFVKHMRNGDSSVVSQFEVQTLLLEYIQRNKLRTPNKKSQITCDSRLQNLFGKPRVMHFEMLKLLESHFHIKEDSHTDDAHGTVVDTEIEADENRDTPVREVKDRKHKRKKGNSRGPQSNLDDYAAIDMHNIGLIYGRRKLIEDLLEDVEMFQDKIVGTFVRIRISGNNQKQDMYRLVQVIGLSKTSDPYKVGKRTTDILLEILNLNKTEVISIDTISNQDFTEDECKRLRQSMKCGLINRPKVGVILDKALELHEARVNDWLESEILRITNLRDRASEKGRRKELRECVEKLALLKTPEERQRRLEEIPEIHDDPKMDPSYESEDDDIVTDETRQDSYIRSRDSSFSRRGRDPISPRSNYSPKDPYPRSNYSPKDPYGGGANQMQAKNWEPDRNLSSRNTSVMAADSTHKNETFDENPRGLGRGDREHLDYRSVEKVTSTTSISRPEMVSGVAPATSPITPTAKVADNGGGPKVNETEKVWHYQDPSGKNQGPFSMVQLRKWNNTGYFPANLRIWRSTETQEDSILLTDALAGKLQKERENRILAGGVLQKQEGDRLSLDQNHASPNALTGLVLPGASNEKWGGNDSLNLPSPTPTQGNAAPAPTPFAGDSGIVSEPSSRLVLPAGVSSLLATGGQPLMNTDNVSANSSTVFSPMMNTTAVSEPQPTMMLHNQHSTQDPNVHPVQNPNMDANVLGAVPTTPGQPQVGYGNWGGSITSAVQNLAANFSNTGGGLALPQPEYWMGQTQGNQPSMQPQTMQPQTMPNFQQWMPQNGPAPVWGPMQGNPNMGWGGPTPPMNMNWAAPVPTMAPPPNMGWVMPPTGPLPGNMNPGWIPPPPPPQPGNPGVQAMAPPNANPGWSGPSAPRPRSSGSNRQTPSAGGPRGSSFKRQTPCPYNTSGRCRKGARCDYLHV